MSSLPAPVAAPTATVAPSAAVTITATAIRDAQDQSMYIRNLPSSPLQPTLDWRPSYTRQTHFATSVYSQEQLAAATAGQPLKVQPPYDITRTFNPGQKAPWNGYARNVDIESDLRGQNQVLTKGWQGNVFVPAVDSDMYNPALYPERWSAAPLSFSALPPRVAAEINRQNSGAMGGVPKGNVFNYHPRLARSNPYTFAPPTW